MGDVSGRIITSPIEHLTFRSHGVRALSVAWSPVPVRQGKGEEDAEAEAEAEPESEAAGKAKELPVTVDGIPSRSLAWLSTFTCRIVVIRRHEDK